MKKLLKVLILSLILTLITSCIKQEEVTELKIISNCVDLTCHMELAEVNLIKSTNLLGKTSEKVVSKKVLSLGNYSIIWDIPGTLASATELSNNNLPPCGNNGVCSANTNPTAYVFGSAGAFNISVTGQIKHSNGFVEDINESSTVSPPGNTITTQLTFSNGDYTAFDPSGTAATSGISWFKSSNSITFTCPSGYAVPNMAPIITGDTNSTLTNSNGNVLVVTLGSDTIAGIDYLVDKTARSEDQAWYWQNTNGWNTYMTCVPIAEVNNYSQ